MSDLQEISKEDKELQEAKIAVSLGYHLTPKYHLWESYFLDKKNKETFGNATISACAAYGLDKSDPKAYNVASNIGSKNMRKSKDIRRKYWEQQGLTGGKLLDLYNDMMIERKDVNMLYSVSEDIGTPLPEYKQVTGPKILNQNNTQINGNELQITFSSTDDKH